MRQIPKGSTYYPLKSLSYHDWLTAPEGLKTESDWVFNWSERIEVDKLERFAQDVLFRKRYVVFPTPGRPEGEAIVVPYSAVFHI